MARLLKAAKLGRHGVRDHLLLLIMFRHGLRVSEAVALCRADVDLEQARLWISRLKNGLSVEQPIAGDELRAIRRWLALREDTLPWLFVSERRQPLTRQSVNYIVARGKAGEAGAYQSPYVAAFLRLCIGNYMRKCASRGQSLANAERGVGMCGFAGKIDTEFFITNVFYV